MYIDLKKKKYLICCGNVNINVCQKDKKMMFSVGFWDQLYQRLCVLEYFVILGLLIIIYNKRSYVRLKFRLGKYIQFNKINIISKFLQLILFMEEELVLEKKICWFCLFIFYENFLVLV